MTIQHISGEAKQSNSSLRNVGMGLKEKTRDEGPFVPQRIIN